MAAALKEQVAALRKEEQSLRTQVTKALKSSTPTFTVPLPRLPVPTDDPAQAPAGGWTQLNETASEAMEQGAKAEKVAEGVKAGASPLGDQLLGMLQGGNPVTLYDKARVWVTSSAGTLLTSVMLAVTLSATGIVGPVVNACIAVGVNLLPTARAWTSSATAWLGRCTSVFQSARDSVEDGLAVVDKKVLDPLNTTKETLQATTKKVTSSISEVSGAVSKPMKQVLALGVKLPNVDDIKKPINDADAAVEDAVQDLDKQVADLSEEFKPQVEKINKFEDAVQLVEPDFDIPDPEDLRQYFMDLCVSPAKAIVSEAQTEMDKKMEPAMAGLKSTTAAATAAHEKLQRSVDAMEGASDQTQQLGGSLTKVVTDVEGALGKAKEGVRGAVDKLVESTPIGAALNNPTIKTILMLGPVGVLFLLNASTAFSTVAQTFESAAVSQAQNFNSSLLPDLSAEELINATVNTVDNTTQILGQLAKQGADISGQVNQQIADAGIQWRAYLLPSISQALLALLQLLLVHFATGKRFVTGLINKQIGSLESEVSRELNTQVRKVVGTGLDKGLKQESDHADAFFKQIDGKLSNLDSSLKVLTEAETYQAAADKVKEKLQGEARAMVSKVDDLLTDAADGLAEKKDEMRQRIKRAYTAATAAEALQDDPTAALGLPPESVLCIQPTPPALSAPPTNITTTTTTSSTDATTSATIATTNNDNTDIATTNTTKKCTHA